MATPTNILDRTQTVSLANPTPPTNSVVTYQGTPPTPRGLAPATIAVPDQTDLWLLADPVNGAAAPELAGFAEAEGTEVSTSVPTGRVTGHSVLGNYSETPNTTHPSGSGVAPIATPILALTSGPTDTTPDFTLTGDLVLGDLVRFHYSTSASFASVTEMTNTIDAAEDTANSITFTTGALALGTWYFRARIDRPVIGNSDWSNTVTDTITAPAYTGPGDIVAGAFAWWGLRAYSAAKIGTAAIRVRRSDAVQKDILIAANGIVDVTDPHFNGLTPYEIVKMYDQTGNNRHADIAVVASVYPVLLLNDNGTLPAINSIGTLEATILSPNSAQPFSGSVVARRSSAPGTTLQLSWTGSAPAGFQFSVAANTVEMFLVSFPTAAAADAVTHALWGMWSNTASKLSVDGVATTVSVGGAGSSGAGTMRFPGYVPGGQVKVWESGYWPGDISASFVALSTNQHTAWSF